MRIVCWQEISYLIFFEKSQNLSSAAVVICALRAERQNTRDNQTLIYFEIVNKNVLI